MGKTLAYRKLATLMRPAAAFTVLAGLAAAGILVSGGPVQAVPDRRTGNATAEAGQDSAKAMKKPLRAERRTDIDALPCGMLIEGDTTIAVTYYNCTDARLLLAPTATATDGSGTTVYTSACQEFLPGEAWFWEITPDALARRPTFIYGVTGCA
jgi:hypothetical protein